GTRRMVCAPSRGSGRQADCSKGVAIQPSALRQDVAEGSTRRSTLPGQLALAHLARPRKTDNGTAVWMFAGIGSRTPIGRCNGFSEAPSKIVAIPAQLLRRTPAPADAWCLCRPLTAKTGVRVP